MDKLTDFARVVSSIASIIVSIAVLVVTASFNRWQRRLAREQLKHQLYERRVTVYRAFLDLLLKPLETSDYNEIKALFRKAESARFEVPFLFNDDERLRAYLEKLCKRVTDEIISNILFVEHMRQKANTNDSQIDQAIRNRESQLGPVKLKIAEDHLEQVSQEFAPFLRLTDFRSDSQLE